MTAKKSARPTPAARTKKPVAKAAAARPLAARRELPVLDADDQDASADDSDTSDELAEIEKAAAELAGAKAKAKPLRVKVPKSKERALIREFGLDVTSLTDEEIEKRRSELHHAGEDGQDPRLPARSRRSTTTCRKSWSTPRCSRPSSRCSTTWASPSTSRRRTPRPCWSPAARGAPSTDEEAEEAAEAALSTVDSEFGRTTDPVRMYMREMGTFELLTREGEIEIAKRIEGGLQAMMLAISASPAIVAEILVSADKIAAGETRHLGRRRRLRRRRTRPTTTSPRKTSTRSTTTDDDDGNGGSKAMTRRLEEMKVAALERFAAMRASFDKLRKAYEQAAATARRPTGPRSRRCSDQLMTVRFTVKTIDRLCGLLRSQVDDVRRYEREIRRIAVDRCGMPQAALHRRASRRTPLNPALGRAGGGARQGLRRGAAAAICRPSRNCRASSRDLQAKAAVAARRPEDDQQEDERRRARARATPSRR